MKKMRKVAAARALAEQRASEATSAAATAAAAVNAGGGDTWATFAVACARESLVAYCVEFEAERGDQMKKTRTVSISE
ncbi:hypothetical protein ACHAXA_000568 [Cyclostephanos tholiformis]|uniref:Uncharacterized protein n=1 Tax=Cyclostephanos tholiformis TaxID=382380 RepID=A0ABD3STL0_9STRA